MTSIHQALKKAERERDLPAPAVVTQQSNNSQRPSFTIVLIIALVIINSALAIWLLSKKPLNTNVATQAAAEPKPFVSEKRAVAPAILPAPSKPKAPPKAASENNKLTPYNQLPLDIQNWASTLKINAVVFKQNNSSRSFAIINGKKAKNGTAIDNDAKLVEIRKAGLLLEHSGYKFILP